MVAGMSSQSFYPVEGTFEMWAAIGLMLRVSVERTRVLAAERAQQRSASLTQGWMHLARPRRVESLDALIFGDGPAPVATAPVPRGRLNPRFAAAAARACAPSPSSAAREARAPSVRFRF